MFVKILINFKLKSKKSGIESFKFYFNIEFFQQLFLIINLMHHIKGLILFITLIEQIIIDLLVSALQGLDIQHFGIKIKIKVWLWLLKNRDNFFTCGIVSSK